MDSCLHSCCHCSVRTHLSLQIVFFPPQLLPWCRHGFIPTCECWGIKTFCRQCEMMTLSTSLGNGVQWNIITRVISCEEAQKNASYCQSLSELWCVLLFLFPRRPATALCTCENWERGYCYWNGFVFVAGKKTKSEFSSWAVCTLLERLAAAGDSNVTEKLNRFALCSRCFSPIV